jgi:hypothetical protein
MAAQGKIRRKIAGGWRRVTNAYERNKANAFTRFGRVVERRMVTSGTMPNVTEIPIIINNFNRLSYLQSLIDRLERANLTNIVILDNDSTYPPLLDFYRTTSHRVIPLGRNIGHLALWESGWFRSLCRSFFVYTDSDVVPIDSCPDDFLHHFLSLLVANPDVEKVGFSLAIDDLPDCYDLKPNVLEWESRFWTRPRSPGLFEATIDTTFALYRPWSWASDSSPALRTGYPYVAQHLPWYENSEDPGEEVLFYKRTAYPSLGFWSGSAPRALEHTRSPES